MAYSFRDADEQEFHHHWKESIMKTIVVDQYPNYEDLIESFEVKVILSRHDRDYQGDSYYLLQNCDEYGILIFGWGSCSGCDALEACLGDSESLTALRDDLWQSIMWLSREAMESYVSIKDFKLEWYGHSSAGNEFITELKLRFG